MKRHRHLSSSDSSDNESPSTSFSSCSKYRSKSKTPASDQKKPAEVSATEPVSSLQLSLSIHRNPSSFAWSKNVDMDKHCWEAGIPPAKKKKSPVCAFRAIAEKAREILFTRSRKFIHCSSQDTADTGYINILELAESMCRYDLDDMDLYWLQDLNEELGEMGCGPVDEYTVEKTIEVLERHCHENMNHAIETEEGLGIEYDEDVICDVCRSPDSEEGNDMVFCDKCNICVHQACYGILKVPEGSWLCRTCVLGIYPQCLLCPKRGGAMKATRAGTKWAHVSCALWIPEVSIACPERMEPITKVSHIPPSRWALVCSLCKLKTGACIQCSVKSCITAFHVTCAFEHSLEMKTILDEGDEVKFKSYCLKHSKSKQGLQGDGEETAKSSEQRLKQSDSEKTSLRAQKLRELEEEFFTLVKVADVASELGLSELVVGFVYEYWKLKRKCNFNKPLLPPKEEEENHLVQPKEDSIHTRMRMFMHLRQDLERVRNLCYMVSRREKLKLSQSKAQEQIFNLQVQLTNQELAAGLPLSCPLESILFNAPPRITLKLKMPKQALGSNKNSTKGPLSSDNSDNVYSKNNMQTPQQSGEKKMKSHHRSQHESRSNGLLSGSHSRHEAANRESRRSPKFYHGHSTGKPLALHAALHGHSSNGNGKMQQAGFKLSKSNGLMDKAGEIIQRDSSSQTSCDQVAALSAHFTNQGSFKKSTMEHFSRSFKEVTDSLVRSTEDLRSCEKPVKKASTKERLWSKQPVDHQAGGAPYQDNDGYCPDLELSDSEAEIDVKTERIRLQRSSSERESPDRDFSRDSHKRGSRNKSSMVCQSSVQR
uniref:Jade family PHD finger 3 n=1 Tax=Latimeria chalumnae TaxID=7897 RepID=H3A0A1_LATCH